MQCFDLEIRVRNRKFPKKHIKKDFAHRLYYSCGHTMIVSNDLKVDSNDTFLNKCIICNSQGIMEIEPIAN